MSISRSAVGSYVRGTNSTLTPTIAGYLVGDALIYVTQEFAGSQTVSPPAGWVELSADVNCHQISVWGRIALTTSETIPSVTWGTGSIASAVVLAYSGVDSSFTTTASAIDRVTNIPQHITANASSRTPSANNTLVLFAGSRNKTSTLNSTSITAPSNFTMVTQDVPNGATVMSGICEWIQIAATTIPAFTTMNTSTDSANENSQGTMIFLASAPPPSGGGGAPVTFPPPRRRKTIVYDYYYPR